METITREYKVFQFNELSEEAQEKAIEDFRNDRVQYDNDFVFEFTLDDWKEKLEKLGFTDPKIYFSGFWSQGDGACFESDCDLVEIIKHLPTKDKYKRLMPFIEEGTVYCSIYSNSYSTHYSHGRTRSIDLEFPFWNDNHPRATALCKELQEDLEEFRYDLCFDLYKELEQAWDYHVSDECIREDIEANEYTFFEDGKMFNL